MSANRRFETPQPAAISRGLTVPPSEGTGAGTPEAANEPQTGPEESSDRAHRLPFPARTSIQVAGMYE